MLLYNLLWKKKWRREKNINLDINERFIKCFQKPIDICIIEILQKDNISENKFLSPDLNYKQGYNYYKNKSIYLAGYPKVLNNFGERHISSGLINVIKNYEFEHNLDTRDGSIGSPICLVHNLLVIGIHKGGNKINGKNYGTFLGVIIDDFCKTEIKIKEKKNIL